MRILLYISDLLVPVTFLIIILYGCKKKVPLYDTFIEGAKEGIDTVFHIMPTLIGLMVAVGILRSSGLLEILVSFFQPLLNRVGFPGEVLPLGLMRLVSSSAATGIALDLFQTFGPDSFIGRVASVMLGCTETVFYTMSVYFMSVNIKNTRYTLSGALFANVVGIIAAFLITASIFGTAV